MPRKYKQLGQEDRDRLSLLKAQGESLRSIAAVLGRNVSTISRELKRNVLEFQLGQYLPHKAQEYSDTRKSVGHERQRLRIPGLRSYVVRRLRLGWSPERIAGRWKRLGNEPISHEAIYQWIYADARNLIPCLVRAHRRRKRLNGIQRKMLRIPLRTPISMRPEAIKLRQELGHWEGDTMIGARNKSALQVLVERKTRYTRLTKLSAKDAESMRSATTKALGSYPQKARRSITYDNGSENVKHVEVNRQLGTVSYFCEPMHSWEKGSVENVAGLVRRRLPKKTDFSLVTVEQVKMTENWLNSLPRKCLGYQTPKEAFRESVALNG